MYLQMAGAVNVLISMCELEHTDKNTLAERNPQQVPPS